MPDNISYGKPASVSWSSISDASLRENRMKSNCCSSKKNVHFTFLSLMYFERLLLVKQKSHKWSTCYRTNTSKRHLDIKPELLTEVFTSEVNTDLSGDRSFLLYCLLHCHNDVIFLHMKLIHLWCITLSIIPQTSQDQTHPDERQYILLQRDELYCNVA